MLFSNTLLAVSGMSPQIVTETLYGLYREDPSGANLPNRIVLVTSASGRQVARSLTGPAGQVALFCRDYQVPEISFGIDDIQVITGTDGNPLPDIRTVDENNAAADFLVQLVRELTQGDKNGLHVSLAGGRKTMGFYAGYALSLFGRNQDRLSHVLVSEGYEGHPDFYYPAPEYREIDRRDGKGVLDASKARVELADIPFLRLRPLLPESVLTKRLSFSESVMASQFAGDTSFSIVIEPDRHRMEIDGREVQVSALQACYYAWLLCALNEHDSGPRLNDTQEKEEERTAEFCAFAADISEEAQPGQVSGGTRFVIDRGWLSNQRTAINKALDRDLGLLGRYYHVTSAGTHGRKYQHINTRGCHVTIRNRNAEMEFVINE